MNLDDLVNLDLEEDEDFCSTLGIDQFPSNFDFDGNLDDGDILDDITVTTGKEITGRWTREEHLLFLKGLEMYGKGWKKIAQLIKTRTVVQIRTHAQKYFLKLTKARENGNSDGLSLQCKEFGSNFRKKMKKRRADRPISVAAPLKPYVKPGKDPEEPVDIDGTLYEFLTPNIGLSTNMDDIKQEPDEAVAVSDTAKSTLPSSYNGVTKLSNAKSVSSSLATVANDSNTSVPLGEVGFENNKGGIKASVSCPQLGGSMTRMKTSERRRLSQQERMPPQWYTTGEHVTALLKEAEGLDWSIDIPTYANTLANGASNNPNPYLQYLLPSNDTKKSSTRGSTEPNRTVSPSPGGTSARIAPQVLDSPSQKRVRISDNQESGIAFTESMPYNYLRGSSQFPIADPSSYVDPSSTQNGQSNFKKNLKSVSFDALNTTSLNEVKIECTNDSPTTIAGNVVSAVSSPNLTNN